MIKERIFLVGCPRSGTTLLQSIIATHPEIASFPESHFFSKLFSNRSSWEQRLGLGAQDIQPCIDDFLQAVNHKGLKAKFPQKYGFAFQYANAFQAVLDEISNSQRKKMWLEKTPKHLHYINEIEKWIQGAKFIHIIRQGQDVVASLYDVTHKHPNLWDGKRSIDKCLDRWIKDITISHQYMDKPNHLILSYEKIISHCESVLGSLEGFLGIPFSQTSLSQRTTFAQTIISKNESWKNSVNQPIQNKGSEKFYKTFSKEERLKILDRLSTIDITDFRHFYVE